MTRLAFYKAKGTWSDRIIRWATRSKYSHVEIMLDDNTGLSASIREGCVREKRINFASGNWDIMEVPWADHDETVELARQHLGARYDIWGILFSHIFALARSHPDHWFCSELVAYALKIPKPHELSPGMLGALISFMNEKRGPEGPR